MQETVQKVTLTVKRIKEILNKLILNYKK